MELDTSVTDRQLLATQEITFALFHLHLFDSICFVIFSWFSL